MAAGSVGEECRFCHHKARRHVEGHWEGAPRIPVCDVAASQACVTKAVASLRAQRPWQPVRITRP